MSLTSWSQVKRRKAGGQKSAKRLLPPSGLKMTEVLEAKAVFGNDSTTLHCPSSSAKLDFRHITCPASLG